MKRKRVAGKRRKCGHKYSLLNADCLECAKKIPDDSLSRLLAAAPRTFRRRAQGSKRMSQDKLREWAELFIARSDRGIRCRGCAAMQVITSGGDFRQPHDKDCGVQKLREILDAPVAEGDKKLDPAKEDVARYWDLHKLQNPDGQAEGAKEPQQIGWLIERQGPEWFTGRTWTRDSLRAARFFSREDAQWALDLMELDPESLLVTEHIWS
jgi:hypothetical protein